MLKKEMKNEGQKSQLTNFDEYRNVMHTEFTKSSVFRKTKLTQGLYWTDFDKDIANQYIREESWFFGIKVSDNLKLIEHSSGVVNNKKDKIGF